MPSRHVQLDGGKIGWRMTLDTLFSAANTAALAGWIVLALSPLAPRWAERISGVAIPLGLSVVYTALAFAFFGAADGGFGSLGDVARLFATREIVLLGWVHYLAFDLFVGAWEVRTGRAEAIPFVLVLPCLALTFLLGPAGFLLFATVRIARRTVRRPAGEARS
jgi:hypothetical protein